MDFLEIEKMAEDATLQLNRIFSNSEASVSEKVRLAIEASAQEEESQLEFDFGDLLQVLRKHDASDLHLKEGSPPMVRINGDLFSVGEHKLTPRECRELIFSICNRHQLERLIQGKEIDIAYSDMGARFRINAFLQKSTYSASVRMIKTEIPTFRDLSMPEQVADLVSYRHGLVLVTGPAGSGKSTTLAAMVNHINTNQAKHIITIEDPIEYIHDSKKCLISQREIGTDTLSFYTGLKYSLRQDPDVILIGEMRDPPTIFIAAQAAETGHLVLSTLHTPNAVQAINRILDVFSGDNQKQMRLLLASNLRGVISQRLLPRRDQEGRVPAVEIMMMTPTISSLILEEKVNDIHQYIYKGKSDGMQTLNQSLYKLLEKGIIDADIALYHSDQPNELKLMIDGKHGTAHGMDDGTLVTWI